MNKNIFFINPHNRINGGNKIVFEYCNHLAVDDFKCFIICDDQVPEWIKVNAYFIDRDQAKKIVKPNDIVIFHWDYDAEYACSLNAQTYYLIQHFIYLDDSIFQLPIKFISVSSYIQKHTKEQYGVESDLILNAIDHSVFYPRKVGRENGRIFVMNRGGWKGVDTVYKAEQLLNKQGIKNVKFVYKDGLTPDEMAIEYSKADIFISSSWYEGFGLPPLEAMACGASVITTDSKGVDDFAIDGETCLKIPVKDPKAMADAVKKLVDDNALNARLKQSGKQKASTFQWDKSIDQLKHLLAINQTIKTHFDFSITKDRNFLGDPVRYRQNKFITALKKYRGGEKFSRILNKLFSIKEFYRQGEHDPDKVNVLNNKIYLPDNKIKLVMLGLEEGMELADYGERSRMIATQLEKSPDISQIIQVSMPVFCLKRWLDKRQLPYKTKYNSLCLSEYEISNNRHFITLRSLCPEWVNWTYSLYSQFIAKQLYNYLTGRLGKNFIIWAAYPRAVSLLQYFPKKNKIIFDAIDNMLVHKDPRILRYHQKIKEAYNWFEKNSDYIIFASEKQKSMFTGRTDCIEIPNGISDIFFHNYSKPAELEKMPSPIIGYVGTLQERIDADLLDKIILACPNFNFVFVGPDKTQGHFEQLKSRQNTHFLGAKPYARIAEFIQHFDICIVPHKIDAFTDSMDPLKLLEYLACAKPVVTTPVAGTEKISQGLYIGNTDQDFVKHINNILLSFTENDGLKLREYVKKEHGWNKRMLKIVSLLKDLM